MIRKEKYKSYVLIILTICFVIMVPMIIQEKLEDKKQYEAFLNEFYKELDSTLHSVENILAKTEEENITNSRLIHIEHKLETLNLLLRMGGRTVDSQIHDIPFFFVGRLWGLDSNEDKGLSDKQKSELNKIQKGLEYMKDGIYSDQSGQENKNITPNEFNEIIEKGAIIGE